MVSAKQLREKRVTEILKVGKFKKKKVKKV